MRLRHLAPLHAVLLLAVGCSETKPDCLGTAVVCGGTCAELKSDNLNCGACGTSCAAGQVCSNGACAVTCAAGQVNCSGSCIEPGTDRNHCGASVTCSGAAAGTACAEGQLCSAGQCGLTCQAGLVDCNGQCTDPLTDRAHCGASGTCGGAAAGTACGAGQVCSAGACAVSCQPGLVNCGGVCADPLNDPRHCGADLTCGLGQTCGAGNVCSAGACVLSCQAGRVDCGGKCVDPQTDRSFCGASATCSGATGGAVCASGQVCNAGACVTSCPAGEQACGGKCVDPKTDPNYCGASAACAGGVACGPSASCYAGLCEPLCTAGQVMCNGTCIDPLTNTSFCGASGYCTGASAGAVCTTSWSCTAGACTPPPCSWTQLWQQPLSSLPAGATARPSYGFTTVAGRTAFTTTNDWTELLAPAGLAPADDAFAVQADLYAAPVALTAGNFRSSGLYALTNIYNLGQQYGLWAGFREKLGQPTQFQWVVSPVTLPATGWDGWDMDIAGVSLLAQTSAATLPLSAWHTLRVEGIRSQCRFRALLDGVVISTWTPATCDVTGSLVGVSGARSFPLNLAWSNLAVYKGNTSYCIP